jgi:hypothetical protein
MCPTLSMTSELKAPHSGMSHETREMSGYMPRVLRPMAHRHQQLNKAGWPHTNTKEATHTRTHKQKARRVGQALRLQCALTLDTVSPGAAQRVRAKETHSKALHLKKVLDVVVLQRHRHAVRSHLTCQEPAPLLTIKDPPAQPTTHPQVKASPV